MNSRQRPVRQRARRGRALGVGLVAWAVAAAGGVPAKPGGTRVSRARCASSTRAAWRSQRVRVFDRRDLGVSPATSGRADLQRLRGCRPDPGRSNVFRSALWGYLVVAGAAAGAGADAGAALEPAAAAHVERELARVRQGQSQRLSGPHPRELESITESHQQPDRKRAQPPRAQPQHAVGSGAQPQDAAGGAALAARGRRQPAELREDVAAQVQRMNEIVSYQLSRAARSGHALYSAPIEIEPRAEEIVPGWKRSTRQGRAVRIRDRRAARVPRRAGRPAGAAGQPAGKRLQVGRQARAADRAGRARPAADGPACHLPSTTTAPASRPRQVERLLQRGVRGDERVQGHGIGLSIVQDIVAAYRGELPVERRRSWAAPASPYDSLPDLAEHAGEDPVPARHFAGAGFLDGPHFGRSSGCSAGAISGAMAQYGLPTAGVKPELTMNRLHRARTIRMDFMAHLSFERM